MIGYVRYGVFETNSSMVHSLTIMSKSEYDDFIFKNNSEEWRWDEEEERWVNINENFEYWDDIKESWFNNEWEYEIKTYTTEHGDTVIAISEAGYDY